LPVVDREHGGIVLARDFSRGVSGCVVHRDDFIRLARDAGGIVDGLQGSPEAGLLVVRGDDERDHDDWINREAFRFALVRLFPPWLTPSQLFLNWSCGGGLMR